MLKSIHAKNILITGNPGVGMTTLIHETISKLNILAGGFYTAEIRDDNNKRWGFKIISLDGQEEVMASVDIVSSRKVSKYGVNPEAVDRIGVTAIEKAVAENDLVVIDEIGRMELISKLFRKAVFSALDSPKPVLGTIAIKETNASRKIKERQDTKVIRLTRDNYDQVFTHIQRILPHLVNSKA
ncbi:NTPase [Candidatus Poribacteria bacterium]|nr:NTPase [Candidatus Poribacteria bacterium]